MQPRQRVLAALRRQTPDRLPYFIRLSPSVIEELRRRTGETDPAVYFQTDIRDVPIAATPRAAAARYRPYLAGKPAGATVNEDGIAEIQGTFQHYKYSVPLLDGINDLRAFQDFPIPDIDAPERYSGFAGAVDALHNQGYAVRGRAGSLFEWAWAVRGFENLLLDFVDRPDLAECLLDRRTETLCGAARLLAVGGIDVLGIHDDVAMQTGPMMSLGTWRRWLKPRWARVLAAAKAAHPDLLVWYHCDGNVTALVPELIEIGVNVLNPVQPECMDGEAIKRQYGDRLAFWGGLGTQRVLPFGTPSDVQEEVRRLARTLGKGGGLLIEPTHQVQPDVPWENIVAYIEAARAAVYSSA
jgi:uroporphyrinogen decarboxylase